MCVNPLSSLPAGVCRKTVCPQMGRGMAARVPRHQGDTEGPTPGFGGLGYRQSPGSCVNPGPLASGWTAFVLCAGLSPHTARPELANPWQGPCRAESSRRVTHAGGERGRAEAGELIANPLRPRGHFT